MNVNKTLILGRKDIEKTMTLRDYIDAVENAFAALADGEMIVPTVGHIPANDGAFHIKSAAYGGKPSYVAVKVNGNFPDNPKKNQLPTIQGAIVLCDGSDGSLLAIIDSIEVTAMRTAAASAVAAKYLANPESQSASVIGCGVQGLVQLMALKEVLPIQNVCLYDQDLSRAESLAGTLEGHPFASVSIAGRLKDATLQSDIILACTSSRSPYLTAECVQPGTFIAAVGADNDDKQELDVKLLSRSIVITDLTSQCAEIGELHHAIKSGDMSVSEVDAELGAVISGTADLTIRADDIVVFDSTGLAIQDVAAAGIIYERAVSAGMGVSVAFA